MGKIRVRAIIIDQDRILLMKTVKEDAIYWFLPGGGVEEGETHEVALIRECKEELGVDVCVKEYFDAIKTKYFDWDQEHLLYFCKITGGKVGTGEGPEFQVGYYYEGEHVPEWLSSEELRERDIKPDGVKEKILNLLNHK